MVGYLLHMSKALASILSARRCGEGGWKRVEVVVGTLTGGKH